MRGSIAAYVVVRLTAAELLCIVQRQSKPRSSIFSRALDENHGATMTDSMVEKLKAAHTDNQEAIFSLFTLSGHVVSGRITAIGNTIILVAGREIAEVPVDRIEAFSYRKQ